MYNKYTNTGKFVKPNKTLKHKKDKKIKHKKIKHKTKKIKHKKKSKSKKHTYKKKMYTEDDFKLLMPKYRSPINKDISKNYLKFKSPFKSNLLRMPGG